MGNEYHSMCCGVMPIMFSIDLVEGGYRTKEIPSLDQEKRTDRPPIVENV